MKTINQLLMLSALSMSTLVSASPIDLTIDPSLSNVDLSIEIQTAVASDDDSDISTLSGMIEIELDNEGNPTAITLNDYMIIIDESMDFDWSFGFFGGADALLDNGAVSYAFPGSSLGPVPISNNDFIFSNTPADLSGVLDISYDIILVGTGSETVDLSEQGSQNSDFSGSISIDGDTLTLSAQLPLNVVQPLADANGNELGTAITTGTATIVATGTISTCIADFTGDGSLNFFDVSAFLNAFNAQDLAADLTDDGVLNFFDVSAFLNAFTAGCP